MFTTTRLKLTGRRPRLPWLGYRAIRRLDTLIETDWSVLEFGSGTSTAWLARRCRAVVSIETDERWFLMVTEQLRSEQLTNVDLRLVEEPQDDGAGYMDALSDYAGQEFEFALVDGIRRDLAVEASIALVKPGGYVLLDNTDLPRENYRVAKRMLLEAAGDNPEITVFNDLCPGLVLVNEATLVRLPSRRASRRFA